MYTLAGTKDHSWKMEYSPGKANSIPDDTVEVGSTSPVQGSAVVVELAPEVETADTGSAGERRKAGAQKWE